MGADRKETLLPEAGTRRDLKTRARCENRAINASVFFLSFKYFYLLTKNNPGD